MRQLKPREGKQPSQGHTACRRHQSSRAHSDLSHTAQSLLILCGSDILTMIQNKNKTKQKLQTANPETYYVQNPFEEPNSLIFK